MSNLKTWVTSKNGFYYNGPIFERDDFCIIFEDERDPQIFIKKPEQSMTYSWFHDHAKIILGNLFDFNIIRRQREDRHKTLFPISGLLITARGYDFRLKSPIPVPDKFKFKTDTLAGEYLLLP